MGKLRFPAESTHGLVFIASVVASGWLVIFAREYITTLAGLTISLTNENKEMLRNGVGGWLVWMPIIGILSLMIGTAIGGWLRRKPDVPLWYLGFTGATYSAVFFVFLIYVPLPEGAARLLAAYNLLFPAAMMAVSPFIFQPSRSSSIDS